MRLVPDLKTVTMTQNKYLIILRNIPHVNSLAACGNVYNSKDENELHPARTQIYN